MMVIKVIDHRPARRWEVIGWQREAGKGVIGGTEHDKRRSDAARTGS
jgi:hypothetical protein